MSDNRPAASRNSQTTPCHAQGGYCSRRNRGTNLLLAGTVKQLRRNVFNQSRGATSTGLRLSGWAVLQVHHRITSNRYTSDRIPGGPFPTTPEIFPNRLPQQTAARGCQTTMRTVPTDPRQFGTPARLPSRRLSIGEFQEVGFVCYRNVEPELE